jgi:hypothetical protein
MDMKSFKLIIIIAIVLTNAMKADAQDIKYVRQQLELLCSPEFHGRAYYKKGDNIAADHLAGQFKKFELMSYSSDYFQNYSFKVNSLEEVSVKINGNELEFGIDYMMNASSGSLSGKFIPVTINASMMKKPALLFSILNENRQNSLIILDSLGLNNPDLYRFVKSMVMSGQSGISGVIEVFARTPGGRIGRNALPGPHIQLNRNALPETIHEVEIHINNKYYENYQTQNVIGYIPGQSEKVIVFTAHYDALGSFGNGNYFPGASDNASGTAMVLDLAKHFTSGEKPYYSIAFMLFSGEEAGLMGSTHYVNNPLFPLNKIKLVINLDMVGTGQEGVILFNAIQRPLEASIVQKINERSQFMKDVDERTGTANSDHYPFNEKEVPAIFFLTKGRSGGGHNIFDTADKLPLYGYENLFKLVLEITRELRIQEIH